MGSEQKGISSCIFISLVNEWEMYDLKTDPDELTNIYGNKKVENVQKSLTKRLKNLRKITKMIVMFPSVLITSNFTEKNHKIYNLSCLPSDI